MSAHKGSRLRRMVAIERATRYIGIGTASCGHLIVRMNHLAVGQRVFCHQCAPGSAQGEDRAAVAIEREARDAALAELRREVEGLHPTLPHRSHVSRAAVLAAIARLEEPR